MKFKNRTRRSNPNIPTRINAEAFGVVGSKNKVS